MYVILLWLSCGQTFIVHFFGKSTKTSCVVFLWLRRKSTKTNYVVFLWLWNFLSSVSESRQNNAYLICSRLNFWPESHQNHTIVQSSVLNLLVLVRVTPKPHNSSIIDFKFTCDLTQSHWKKHNRSIIDLELAWHSCLSHTKSCQLIGAPAN